MDLNGIILLAAGFIITTLIGIASYLSRERLESLKEEIKTTRYEMHQSNLKLDSITIENSNKLDAIAAEIISVKSKILEVSNSNDKIENKMSYLHDSAKVVNLDPIKTELTLIKEYQIKKIEPALNHIIMIQKEQDLQKTTLENYGKVLQHFNAVLKK